VAHGIQAVKASIHQEGEKLDPFDPAKRSKGVNQELLRRTQEKLIPAIHPHLEKEPATVIRCLYTMTPDKLYFVGPHYEDSRFLVATGRDPS
jgi:glycine/D-amino acid oxidase-like deaminating enzyme